MEERIKKGQAFLQEFKEFAMKGNVVDLAVGVIIGGAFGKVVSSLVSDIIMPPLGILIGGVDFKNLSITLKDSGINESGQSIPAVTLNYGAFIQTAFDFVIVAAAIFVAIKLMNRLRRREEHNTDTPKPNQEKLLEEIRDLLKQNK